MTLDTEGVAMGVDTPDDQGAGSAVHSASFWTGQTRLIMLPIVVSVLAFAFASIFSEQMQLMTIAGATFVLVSIGLHVLIQWSGQISLAQGFIAGFAAFVTAQLNDSWSLPMSCIGGVAAGTLLSLIIGIPALRVRGFELAILTLAAGFAIEQWLFKRNWLFGDTGTVRLTDTTFFGFDLIEPAQVAVVALLITAPAVLLTTTIGGSSFGRSMRMIAADERAAAAYGVNVGLHKLFAFVYAGFCAALGGVVFALQSAGLEATAFDLQDSIIFLTVVIIGGPGPVWGAVFSGVLLGAIPILLGPLLQEYLLLVGGLALLLIIKFSQGGLNHALNRQGKGLRILFQVLLPRVVPALLGFPPAPSRRSPAAMNPLAIASMVFGILALVLGGLLTAIFDADVFQGIWVLSFWAVIFGRSALNEIKHSGGGQGGREPAIAGIGLGFLGLVLMAIYIVDDGRTQLGVVVIALTVCLVGLCILCKARYRTEPAWVTTARTDLGARVSMIFGIVAVFLLLVAGPLFSAFDLSFLDGVTFLSDLGFVEEAVHVCGALALVAALFGNQTLSRVQEPGSGEGGRRMAIAGLTLGLVGLFMFVISLVHLTGESWL